MSTIGRPPPPAPQLPAVRPAAPEAVRQAQRAFFAAAAGQPATEPAALAEEGGPTVPSEPERYLRPGSLLDIKV